MEKKHYQTAGRTKLADYLKKTADLPPRSAEDIYGGLLTACTADGGTAPGRSSVYRMLSALCESGEVNKFRADAGSDGYVYQYVGAGEHCEGHLHLHCQSCGRIAHLKCHCNEEICAQLMASHGFMVDSGRSVLYGVCAACQKKVGEARG